MGKPKGPGRKAAEGSTQKVDSKSKSIEKAKDRITRERQEKSYREAQGTDSEEEVVPEIPDSDPEIPPESESDFKADSDSSGSEYGKKKKASPVKGKAGRPAKRQSTSSPAKRGRGRGRGRAPKAAAKPSRNGRKKAKGDSSEEEASLSESDGAYPPPAKMAKSKPKATTSPKRGRAAKKAAANSDEDAPPRRGGRQRTEMKYNFDDSDEESDPNDRVIPGAFAAAKKAPTGTGRGRGRKPAAAPKPQPEKKYKDDDEEEDHSESDDEVVATSSKRTATGVGRNGGGGAGSESDEKPQSKGLVRKAAATARAKNAESDNSEEEEEEEYEAKPVAKKTTAGRPGRKPAAKKPAAPAKDDSEETEEEEVVATKGTSGRKPAASAAPTLKTKKEESDSEESDSQPLKIAETEENSGRKSESMSHSEEDEVDAKPEEKKENNSVEKKNDLKPKSAEVEEDDDSEEVASKDGSENGKTKVLKNKTDTDYSKIDFSCSKKSASGEDWNNKISCWNISGIKAWVLKKGLEYLKRESPDVMCLQEVKCNEKTAPPEAKAIEGYPHSYWSYSASLGQSGVAVISKTEPKNVSYGIEINDGDSEEDKKIKESFNKEGRLIVAEFEKYILFNAYVPNSGRGITDANHPKPYPPKIINGERLNWDRLLREYIKAKDALKPVIVVGDLNVSHEAIDLANPTTNSSTAGFTKEEREGMSKLLEETKLFDSFRALYPDQTGAYTYWSYMHNAREKNIGWRLDYFLLSEKLKDSLCENVIRSQVFGSDHCPIVLYTHI